MFSDINRLKSKLEDQNKTLQYVGLFMGRVCHVRPYDNAVRVIQVGDSSQYVTWWLRPSRSATSFNVKVNDFVLFGFPTLDPKEGVYIDLFNEKYDLGTLTIEQVIEEINESIEEYDAIIKAYITTYVLSLNYIDSSELNTALLAYVSNASLASTLSNYITSAALAALNYVTTSALTTALAAYSTTAQSNIARQRATHRYLSNNFVQGSKGASIDVPDGWINRHITIYCLGSDLPGSGGSQDGGSAIGININGAASQNNSRYVVGNIFYLKISTTANIVLNGINGITVGGVLNGAFLLPLRTCWKMEKTASTTWTLTNMNDYDFVPYS